MAEALGDLDTLCWALADVADIYMLHGEFERSRLYQQREFDAAERQGDLWSVVVVMHHRALLAFYMGDWGQARSRAWRRVGTVIGSGLEESIELMFATGDLDPSDRPFEGPGSQEGRPDLHGEAHRWGGHGPSR